MILIYIHSKDDFDLQFYNLDLDGDKIRIQVMFSPLLLLIKDFWSFLVPTAHSCLVYVSKRVLGVCSLYIILNQSSNKLQNVSK